MMSFSVSTAQEQSNVYPSHSYNTSVSPPPNPVPAPAQEDLGGPRKNGDPNLQEQSVMNFTTANACDTVTIHSGKAMKKPSDSSLRLCIPLCFLKRIKTQESFFCLLLFSSIIPKKTLRYSRRRPKLCHTDRLRRRQIPEKTSVKLVCSNSQVSSTSYCCDTWNKVFGHGFVLSNLTCINLSRNRTGGKRTSLSWKQRVFMLLLVGVLGFFTLIIIMAKLGRASAGSDPNLDPLLNPNIRVGKNWIRASIFFSSLCVTLGLSIHGYASRGSCLPNLSGTEMLHLFRMELLDPFIYIRHNKHAMALLTMGICPNIQEVFCDPS